MIDEHFRASILKDGPKSKININAKPYFATKLNKLPHGHGIWVHVYDKVPKRSDRQNRLYWMYLQNIEDETGNERDALHEHFKRQYLAIHPAKRVKTPLGEEIEVQTYKSTTDLTKSEFSEYMASIERDTGVLIPDTDEFHYGTREDQRYKDMPAYPDTYQEPTL